MPIKQIFMGESRRLSRRSFLLGLGTGLGLSLLAGFTGRDQPIRSHGSYKLSQAHNLGPARRAVGPQTRRLNPMAFLKAFDYGKVTQLPDGRTLRQWTLIVREGEIEVAEGVGFEAWMFNENVPGPTLRCTEGDLVRVRFINQTPRRHSIHFHGIRPAKMDGIEPIEPDGGEFIYQFTAEPSGLFPYHCHTTPVAEHIQRGLYGLFIVDPLEPRPPANEMVIVLNSYDLDADWKSDLYSINGVADYFMHHPIPIKQNELVRIYLLNMTEFDPVVSLHLHANTAYIYRSDGSLTPEGRTDIITLAQAERAIVEFSYKFPGLYMFHPHQTIIAERGMIGFFEVK